MKAWKGKANTSNGCETDMIFTSSLEEMQMRDKNLIKWDCIAQVTSADGTPLEQKQNKKCKQ
jgi:hypothetical protein